MAPCRTPARHIATICSWLRPRCICLLAIHLYLAEGGRVSSTIISITRTGHCSVREVIPTISPPGKRCLVSMPTRSRPIVGSPAIDHGVAVGLTSDIASNPIGANPDIGAYEHEGAGLVAHWQLDDGEGSTVATDASGGNHDGTLLGGPAWTGGRFGRALAFDGADDGVQAGTSGDFNLTTALTITAWIRTVNGSFLVGNSEGAVIAGKNNAYNLSIRETEGNPRLIVVGNNGTPVACGHYSGIATDTAWHHVAGTYDGAAGIMRLYIDGVLKQECNTGV